jgi:hypothetical protein
LEIGDVDEGDETDDGDDAHAARQETLGAG